MDVAGAAPEETPFSLGFSFFALIVLAINSMNGPAILSLPTLFQHGGLAMNILVLVLMAVATGETVALTADLMDLTEKQAAEKPNSVSDYQFNKKLHHERIEKFKDTIKSLGRDLGSKRELGAEHPVREASASGSGGETMSYGSLRFQHNDNDGLWGDDLHFQPPKPVGGLAAFPLTVQRRVECADYGELALFHFGGAGYYCTQFQYTVTLYAVNLAQGVLTCQAMDAFLIWVGNRTEGLEYAPCCTVETRDKLRFAPYSNEHVISLGWVITAVSCTALEMLPMEKSFSQYGVFVLFVVSVIVFLQHFLGPAHLRHSDHLDEAADRVLGSNWSTTLGIMIFNFAFNCLVPGYYQLAPPKVNFRWAMRIAIYMMAVVFIIFGMVGSIAYRNVDSNILSNLLHKEAPLIIKLSVFGFVMSILPQILNYNIMLYQNLVDTMQFNKGWAVLWAVVVPWTMILLAYPSDTFGDLINWSALLTLGFSNYTVPLTLYIKARKDAADFPHARTLGGHMRWIAGDADLSKAVFLLVTLTSAIMFIIIFNIVYTMATGNPLR